MTRNQFRILVVLNQLLVLALVVVQEMFDQSLPPELRSDPGGGVSVMNPETSSVVPAIMRFTAAGDLSSHRLTRTENGF